MSSNTLIPYHRWLKTHPGGTMDEYFTDVQGLTPYDKGTRLEPRTWVTSTAGVTRDNADDFGKVDFDNEESSTVATLWIERQDDGSYTLKGYTNQPLKIEVEEEL